MTANFLHNSTSDVFRAVVEPECTAELAVRGLIDAGFLSQPRHGSYDLVVARTGQPILPKETFGAVGVIDDELINVFRRGAGA